MAPPGGAIQVRPRRPLPARLVLGQEHLAATRRRKGRPRSAVLVEAIDQVVSIAFRRSRTARGSWPRIFAASSSSPGWVSR